MSKDTGGPAFPHELESVGISKATGHTFTIKPTHGPGMTLRDYFAAKVMMGFAASSVEVFELDDLPDMAQLSYKWADAMLKAREA